MPPSDSDSQPAVNTKTDVQSYSDSEFKLQPGWIRVQFNHFPHYGSAPGELINTTVTQVRPLTDISNVKEFTKGCNCMVIKGEIRDIPSRLDWNVIASGLPTVFSEESIINVYHKPAPLLHVAIRSGTILFSLFFGIVCMLYGMALAGLLAYAFAISLLPTRFAPGRPFNFLKRYNPKNILYYADFD